jgi:hypothetical protein
MTCPHTKNCALFPLFSQQAFLATWKTTYCEADFKRCARHRAAENGDIVPATLLPNGKHLATKVKPR